MKTIVTGRIARALAIFAIDEVVVFDDSPPVSRNPHPNHAAYTADSDPCHFIAHLLSYVNEPPFLRKTLFPLHPNLRQTALLPSLDMPHHPNPKEWIQYREGVTVEGETSTGDGTLVEVGLGQPVEIEAVVPPGLKLTLKFPDDESQYPQIIEPEVPRTEGGYYWGYSVRKCDSLSAVFTESTYPDGYDYSIATSERGDTIPDAFPHGGKVNFNHLIIFFGGPRGLEFAAMNDKDLSNKDVTGPNTKNLFDSWVNVLPNQGSRTIRTEEAILIALTALRGVWESG